MAKKVVAIVGRPNVGKSTLFNVLAGEKISIIKDVPGVTRDRIYADCNWRGTNFQIIDTGGIEPESDNIIVKQMRRQAELAMDVADVIVFITDVNAGVTQSDEEVATMLRHTKKPVILVCNNYLVYNFSISKSVHCLIFLLFLSPIFLFCLYFFLSKRHLM